MADLDDDNDQALVLDAVEDPVAPLPESFSQPCGRGSLARLWILATTLFRSDFGRASISLAAEGLMKSL